MEMNKQNFKLFRQDFNDAVKSLQQKYNVFIELGDITYSASSFRAKLSVDNVEDDMKNAKYAKYANAFNANHKIFDLDKSLLNKEFVSGTKTYTFVGLDLAKRKYVCLITDKFGNMFNIDVDTIKNKLGA